MLVQGTTIPTEYQPYWEETLKIPESVTSIEGYGDGLSKTDLSMTNYVDFERSKFVQNVKKDSIDVLNPSNVQISDTSEIVQLIFRINDMMYTPKSNIICDKYISQIVGDRININGGYENYLYLRIPYSYLSATPTTKEEGKTLALEYFNSQGITSINVIYPLATPIETDIDLVDRTYKVDNLGTETLVNEYNQKAFASIEYGVSLKSQIIENSENIANLKNDKLDKVIGSGGTDRVYGIDMSGKQIVIPVARYDMYTNTNCLARVDSNGEVKGVTTGRTYTAFTNVEYVQNNFETIINSNLKVQNLQKIIDKQAKRIEQLELASEGTILSTYENVSEVSYTRLIGANVLPYGTLDKVGGMTYKSKNLISSEFIQGGFSNESGELVTNSTTTVVTKDYIKVLPNTTYTFSIKESKACVFGEYDKDYNFLGMSNNNGLGKTTITTKENTKYIRLKVYYAEGNSLETTTNRMLNYGSEALPYEEYFEGLRNTKVSDVISNGANLLDLEDVEETTQKGITYSVKDGVIYASGINTESGTTIMLPLKTTIPNGVYVGKLYNQKENGVSNLDLKINLQLRGSDQTYFTAINNNNSVALNNIGEIGVIAFYASANVEYNNISFAPMIVSGTTAPTEYKPYKAPITYSIPSQIQALQGYGIGINETYKNYIDYERKVFVRMVEALTINGTESGWTRYKNFIDNGEVWHFVLPLTNNANATDVTRYFFINSSNEIKNAQSWGYTVANDKTLLVASNRVMLRYDEFTTVDEIKSYLQANPITIVYVLETPIETDISQYLTQDNVIEMEANGSLTFENEHQQAVPNEISYQERNV